MKFSSNFLLWWSIFLILVLMLSGPRQALLGLVLLGIVFGVRSILQLNRSQRILAASKGQYGFWIAASGTDSQLIQATSPGDFQAAGSIILVGTALNRYPRSFFAICGVRRLVLCCHLQAADGREGLRQRLGGCCDLGKSVVYLNLSSSAFEAIDGSKAESLMRALHHELFHLLDWTMYQWQDEAWAKLNPPGFFYAQEAGRTGTAPRPGFITGYATTAIQEDRAELFSYMMMDYPEVKRRMGKDPILAAKVDHLKGMFLQCCPEMNEAFWQCLH